MRYLVPLIGVVALAGCTASAADQPRTAKAETRLAKALEGKTAGRAVSCLPQGGGWDMDVIDDNTILFRRAGTIFRNDPQGGCRPLGSGTYTLVTRIHTGSLCNGDISRVVDTSTGSIAGTCSMGDFVPYR